MFSLFVRAAISNGAFHHALYLPSRRRRCYVHASCWHPHNAACLTPDYSSAPPSIPTSQPPGTTCQLGRSRALTLLLAQQVALQRLLLMAATITAASHCIWVALFAFPSVDLGCACLSVIASFTKLYVFSSPLPRTHTTHATTSVFSAHRALPQYVITLPHLPGSDDDQRRLRICCRPPYRRCLVPAHTVRSPLSAKTSPRSAVTRRRRDRQRSERLASTWHFIVLMIHLLFLPFLMGEDWTVLLQLPRLPAFKAPHRYPSYLYLPAPRTLPSRLFYTRTVWTWRQTHLHTHALRFNTATLQRGAHYNTTACNLRRAAPVSTYTHACTRAAPPTHTPPPTAPRYTICRSTHTVLWMPRCVIICAQTRTARWRTRGRTVAANRAPRICLSTALRGCAVVATNWTSILLAMASPTCPILAARACA